MPAKKKVVKKTVKKAAPKAKVESKKMFAGTGVFGWMVIGLAVGGLIVLLRYLIISWMLPADIYMIEPTALVPGMAQ
jgi:hypothetical protein